ncbi:MAG TPA: FAD-dependent oxidoreductase [Pyrinomonadaceae bacterium]|nr:FAD-dependent oxidoreductase [Pyrinomonadaceae bacterium]
MDCEVVVVGGGIGGLAVAALLAQRGVNVCLLERERQVGGCAAPFEKFDHSFESGYGLFSGWNAEEIHQRVFSELPVDPPDVRVCEPPYVVRLPDASEIALTSNQNEFETSLRQAFPECAEEAVVFYRDIADIGAALRRTLRRTPELLSASRSRRAFALLPEGRLAVKILKSEAHATLEYLQGASLRFRRFIDVQLQTFALAGSAEVSYLQAALALSAPQAGLWSMRGGAAALADRLAESVKRSGGRIRLDTPVLRLAYDSAGNAVGVDLLSGERVTASKAIVSNLTLWDTYGKLVGLNRTPTEIRKRLKTLRGWGAYLLYLSLDQTSGTLKIPDHVLALADWQEASEYNPENNQLMFAAAPAWDSRAPNGKLAVTVHVFTDVDEWFTFHNDEAELEAKDQQMLEQCWQRLHAAIPELGSTAEVIETATPRSFYETTRRKLGMVGGIVPPTPAFWQTEPSYKTSLSQLFIISDTTSFGGIEGLVREALALANHLTPGK